MNFRITAHHPRDWVDFDAANLMLKQEHLAAMVLYEISGDDAFKCRAKMMHSIHMALMVSRWLVIGMVQTMLREQGRVRL